jgi:hypothetical protein
MAKKKQWTYYKSATITSPDGTKESFATQLYQTSIYIIWNNNPASQGGIVPSAIERLCKRIKADLDASKLTNVEWGTEITVTKDADGMFVEVQ